jgi:hypothetical protein
MAEAIIIYKKIPGFEELDKGLYKNPQFAQRMDFDVFRRLILKAKPVGGLLYEFSINGITYRAKLISDMEEWEKAYYANSRWTCIFELMNVYP